MIDQIHKIQKNATICFPFFFWDILLEEKRARLIINVSFYFEVRSWREVLRESKKGYHHLERTG